MTNLANKILDFYERVISDRISSCTYFEGPYKGLWHCRVELQALPLRERGYRSQDSRTASWLRTAASAHCRFAGSQAFLHAWDSCKHRIDPDNINLRNLSMIQWNLSIMVTVLAGHLLLL